MSSDRRPGRRGGFLRRFLRSERGTISTWSLFLFLSGGAIAATAVDITHLTAARTELQVSADIAAHAAIFRRNQGSTTIAAARRDAIRAVEFGMPDSVFGDVIEDADFTFGVYDRARDTFVADPRSLSAVLVTTGREAASRNSVPAFFFRLVGIGEMDVSAVSVAEAYDPECTYQGFLSNGLVDVRSGNVYTNGFCMHSQVCVDMQNGNEFRTNTIVSMPSLSCFWRNRNEAQTYQQNPGLREALRTEDMRIKVLDLIRTGEGGPMWQDLLSTTGEHRPDSVTGGVTNVRVSRNRDVYPSQLTPNAVNRFDCDGTETLSFQPPSGADSAAYRNVVILTDCLIQFSGKVSVEDAIIYTTSVDPNSVRVNTGGGGGGGSGDDDDDDDDGASQPEGFNIGRREPSTNRCAPGGGATIITRGGFRNSAAMTMNAGQIIALGQVQFSANAGGWGASIISHAGISGTSNMTFNGCATGHEEKVTVPYFRLAR